MKTDKSNKIIFRTFSLYTKVKYLILRIIALVCALACFYNFDNNPIVTFIAGIFFLIFFLFVGDSELVVYKDRFRFCFHSLIARKKAEIPFSELSSFRVNGSFGLKMDVVSDASPIYLHDPYNIIEVLLRDGTTKHIKTYIYIDKLRKASDYINNHIPLTTKSR